MQHDDPFARDVPPPAAQPPVTEVVRIDPVAWSPEPVRRRRPRVATVVLALLLVATLVGAGLVLSRMFATNEAWRDSTQRWETLARSTGEQLAASQADLDATRAELEAVSAQLATAQERITQLADEKAQLGDTSASQQQLADYQARVSQAAGQVATALASCVDGQQRLIGYLQDSDQYDPADLARFTSDVQTVCATATDANAALQRELDR
ncbi:hypothetical protein [uncultured Cellulomonas sp.]|uniref:hypothetical protein n=1 Tax=uncultured Cellulomonas sp. TaxID=189682 RepID=UPI0028EE55EB|nr:hypothetical protein [uncultured Cellulomonas sp.]